MRISLVPLLGLSLSLTWRFALGTSDNTTDYDDWSWVKKWAAIGDSFTAGIGSGVIYSSSADDISCSRYDYSYPAIMNRFFGSSVTNFTYLACSGDTSADIAKQIDALDSGQDLVVMTAGGNDLCLSSMIASCILSPVSSYANCERTMDYAESAVEDYLKGNIQSLLESLDAKMTQNGIVVFNYYAKYFDDSTDDCATSQTWAWPIGSGLPLTTDRRSRMNSLVDKTNAALKEGLEAASVSNMILVASDWDPWVSKRSGYMCMPGASGDPADASNDGLMFFKLDTSQAEAPLHDELRRRSLGEESWLQYEGNLTAAQEEEEEEEKWRQAMLLHELVERDVVTPDCDNGLVKRLLGLLLGDGIGKIFHPNQLGHEVIASFALNAARSARAQSLDETGPSCTSANAFTTLSCAQKNGSHAYATDSALYANTANFCKAAKAQVPAERTNWAYSHTYDSGTLDEAIFTVQLSNGANAFDEDECNKAVNRILDDCDGDDPDNPMNWKFGGKLVDGSYSYTIAPQRDNRPWPVPTEPTGSCKGSYKFLWDSYTIYGAGWASWDSGQKTLRPNSTHCFGKGLTKWKFTYYDEPNDDGMEWKATFRSPIWTRARCYNNNKVQAASGGPSSGGCKGNG
ncbi:SGNH hydrolase [Aspergillus ellipticus CBS 707.79]|uniref:SGNH hydrolase n=1 Tax=Aspergillus ellipticus CBS 707.79 TaxID=1448320 RepID=A0A319DKU5_9EURO|nr:SGNH hydrolase [Aspergillus ellipticus CBS 707.79]